MSTIFILHLLLQVQTLPDWLKFLKLFCLLLCASTSSGNASVLLLFLSTKSDLLGSISLWISFADLLQNLRKL